MSIYDLHLCTENPCPLEEEQMAAILNNGFKTHYTKIL